MSLAGHPEDGFGPADDGCVAPSTTAQTASSDPAPDPIDAARQRTAEYVNNIATNTLLDLARRRDELDNCMERIKTSQRALTHYIGEFARFNYEALQISKDIQGLVASATVPFAADPPATITQSREPTK